MLTFLAQHHNTTNRKNTIVSTAMYIVHQSWWMWVGWSGQPEPLRSNFDETSESYPQTKLSGCDLDFNRSHVL